MTERAPILVTGVPRSGTTWLARLLAGARGTALAGREPMNPRGRQYALGGSLDGWARLTELTSGQRRRLRLAYRGLNPWVYSRYGSRQWAGPLPGTRLVVKDPFAMLSVPAVVEATGAVPVLVYRHPGAVLASYRRMGWRPDLGEVRAIAASGNVPAGVTLEIPDGELSEAEQMGLFWAFLHEVALADATAARTNVVVVAHHELASGGATAGRALAQALDLPWNATMGEQLAKESGGAATSSERLHNFDRSPAQVADEWRSRLDPDEVDVIERVTAAARARVSDARVRLVAG